MVELAEVQHSRVTLEEAVCSMQEAEGKLQAAWINLLSNTQHCQHLNLVRQNMVLPTHSFSMCPPTRNIGDTVYKYCSLV